MLTANSAGNTDIGNLTGGSALQKDPLSSSPRRKKFLEFIKSCKGKFFQKSQEKKVICIDFDGVINTYQSGWKGFDIIPDPPVEGAIPFLFDLSHTNDFNVFIFSARCAQPAGVEAIKKYLDQYEKEYRDYLYSNSLGVPKTHYLSKRLSFTHEKIPAHIYLDDRSLNFNGSTFPSIDEIRNFKSWIDKEEFQKSALKISKDEYHPNPSHAQKRAGNYKKAHVKVQGFDISIENPKGTYRSGRDPNGKEWKCKMVHHYGYFKRTEGSDGDHIDCFIGPNTKSELVYIVNQINPTSGQFDEHKVMLGFDSLEEAKEGYLVNYSPGWKGLGEILSMTLEQFRTWLEKADTTKKAKEVIVKSGIKNFFSKAQKAQVGETRTWNDGKVHRKTDKGWVEVSGGNRSTSKENPESKTGKPGTSQQTLYERKAIESLSRWQEYEKQAKIKNKERIANMKPEERNKAFDIKNAAPGDIVRIERPIDGRVNRGHLAKVLDKIDGHLKVMLPSGSIFLFLASDLAFAKSNKKSFWDKLFPFSKGRQAQVGEIRTWSDGNKYRKESNGWKMVGEAGEKAAHQTTSNDAAKKADMSKEEHGQAVEKAMQNGTKIPVKVLREYPELLEKYPQYKKRVSAIDSLSKGIKKGERVGKEIENSSNSLRDGKIPDAVDAIGSLKSKESKAIESIKKVRSRKSKLQEAVRKVHEREKLELSEREQKKVDDLENRNLATEALMVYAKKLKNKEHFNALKKNREKHLKLGHLSSDLKKERDDIYHEVMRNFKSDKERLGNINKPNSLSDSQIFENVRDASLLPPKKLNKNVAMIDLQISIAEKTGNKAGLKKLELKGTLYRVAQLLQEDKSMSREDVASLVRHGAELPDSPELD